MQSSFEQGAGGSIKTGRNKLSNGEIMPSRNNR